MSSSGSERIPIYLQQLPVADDVRWRLAELGAADPVALLGMMRASRSAFDQWLGRAAADRVLSGLERMVSAEDLELVATPGPMFPSSGALLEQPAPISMPFVAWLHERDKLFAALESERRAAEFAARGNDRVAAIQRQLEELVQPPPIFVSSESSPVDWLLPHLAVAPFRAAPERAEALHALMDRHDISIKFAHDPRTLSMVDLSTGQVRFGLSLAERIWACAYAYVEWICHRKIYGPGANPELPADVRAALEAVHQAEHTGQRLRWPEELPFPDPGEAPGAAGITVNEVFLAVGAFVLLHDIGHLRAGRRPDDRPGQSLEREYEADDWAANDWAAEWMLGSWREYGAGDDEWTFVKRSLGGTICLGHLAALESHPRTSPKTRPNPAQRLLRYLRRHVNAEPGDRAMRERPAWYVAAWIVRFHLQAAGLEKELRQEFRDPAEFLETAAKILG